MEPNIILTDINGNLLQYLQCLYTQESTDWSAWMKPKRLQLRRTKL